MALQCPLFPWLQKEKLSAQASLKRHTSLNDLSLTRDEQEIEFLRLQVLEQQHVIDDLSLVCLRLRRCQALCGVPGDMGLRDGIRAAGNVGAQGGGGACHGAPPGDGAFLLHSSRKRPPLALHDITSIRERFPWLLFLLSSYPEFAAIKKQHQPLLKRVSGLYRVGVIDLSWRSLMLFF